MEKNLRYLEAAALPPFKVGHIPLVGEWVALPLMKIAGSQNPGDEIHNEIAALLPGDCFRNVMLCFVSKGNPKAPIRMFELQKNWA